jgi:O-antigen/teichoic acid export membrane protein
MEADQERGKPVVKADQEQQSVDTDAAVRHAISAEGRPETPLWSLVRHTMVYGSGYVTMAIASFVLVPIYTRYLSPASYGLLGLMLVLYGVMKQVYDLGFTNSVGRFFFDNKGEDQTAARLLTMRATAVGFLVGFGGLLTAVLCLEAGTWSRLLTQSARHADLVRIVAVTLYAETVAIPPLTLMRMRGRSRLYVSITLMRFVATLALSIVFVMLLKLGVRGALLANALSAVAVLIFLVPDYFQLVRASPSWPLLREMLAFGVPFFPVLLSSWFIDASDRYLLGIYRNHAEVGYYVLGYKVAQVMQIAVAAFSMGWAPLRYSIYQRPDARDVYRRLTSAYVTVASLLTVGLALFAREIVSVIAPASYASAAIIVPLIAASYALNGLYVLMVTGMGVTKKTTPMMWIVGAAAVANIGINIILIPLWGMRAAALTTVLANLIMVGGSCYYSQKYYPISYDWSRIARVGLIGVAIVASAVWLTPGRGTFGIAAAAVGWVVFVVLLVTSGAIPRSELGSLGMRSRWLGLRRAAADKGLVR